MKIIFAQGNPGPIYAQTRHNTGFIAIDALAREWETTWKTSSKFQADIAEASVNGNKALLVKPQTFYNETGQAARGLLDYYKLSPADLLVIHDDMALPFGTIRVRNNGSDAGNNGIKSLNAHVGQQYTRIKVGIWTSLRNSQDDKSFVTGMFSKKESDHLQAAIVPEVIVLAENFLSGTIAPSSQCLLPDQPNQTIS